MCLPSGEPSTRLEVQPYAHLPAKVERGEVGVRLVQGALQSTFDCPYHRLDSSLAANTKLVRQEEVTSVGVPNNGLRRQPVDHFPYCDRAEASIRFA
jgi:hypothetical protein